MKVMYPMGSFSLIVQATNGDAEAIYYKGYISKRSLRPMIDEYGNQLMVVDEMLQGRMQNRLITKILSFEIK